MFKFNFFHGDMVDLARDSKVGGSSFALANLVADVHPLYETQIIGSCMPDLRQPAQCYPIVVPEGPGMFSMSRSKRVFWRSSHHGYCAKPSDCFRLLLSDDRSHSEKGTFIRFPQANLTQMAGFVAESTSFHWFPLVRFADSQQLRPLQGSKRPGGIGAGHT